jgi:hypothetical protein
LVYDLLLECPKKTHFVWRIRRISKNTFCEAVEVDQNMNAVGVKQPPGVPVPHRADIFEVFDAVHNIAAPGYGGGGGEEGSKDIKEGRPSYEGRKNIKEGRKEETEEGRKKRKEGWRRL